MGRAGSQSERRAHSRSANWRQPPGCHGRSATPQVLSAAHAFALRGRVEGQGKAPTRSDVLTGAVAAWIVADQSVGWIGIVAGDWRSCGLRARQLGGARAVRGALPGCRRRAGYRHMALLRRSSKCAAERAASTRVLRVRGDARACGGAAGRVLWQFARGGRRAAATSAAVADRGEYSDAARSATARGSRTSRCRCAAAIVVVFAFRHALRPSAAIKLRARNLGVDALGVSWPGPQRGSHCARCSVRDTRIRRRAAISSWTCLDGRCATRASEQAARRRSGHVGRALETAAPARRR